MAVLQTIIKVEPMPELPEVETVRAGLSQAVCGKTIASVRLRRADLRFSFPERFAETLAGRRISAIHRRAKYLLFELDGGVTLLAHLGMTGRFISMGKLPQSFAPHDHVVLTFTDSSGLIYNDARRFGIMDICETRGLKAHPLLAHLGPEPLDKAFNATYLRHALSKRKAPVKQALMDQELVVGVGNIYASEALFKAGVDPRISGAKAAPEAAKIASAIRAVLKAALASGGSSLRNFVDVNGETGYFQHAFAVYGRAKKPCFTCGTEIHTLRQGGRSTFFCPGCQA